MRKNTKTKPGARENPALAALRHHVTGAIERGEAEAIVERLGYLDELKKIAPSIAFSVSRKLDTYRDGKGNR